MRKFGGVRAGFSPYLSYMLLRIRTRPELLIRIVALEKGAGSSPVGHPPVTAGGVRLAYLATGASDRHCRGSNGSNAAAIDARTHPDV